MESQTIEQLKLLFAVWGAVLSTMLAIKELLFNIKRRLRISARSDSPFETLDIKITNIGHRPITVSSVSLAYGLEPTIEQPLIEYKKDLPKKLEDGDELPIIILRDEIISAVKWRNVKQTYNHRVWVTIELSTGKKLIRVVNIDKAIIQKPYPEGAEYYIASDIFLGFEQLPSRLYRGNSMRSST